MTLNFGLKPKSGWLEFTVPFRHKYGYIRDETKVWDETYRFRPKFEARVWSDIKLCRSSSLWPNAGS